jgi:hypothetical protein
VRVVDRRPEPVCAWRASLSEGSRFAVTQALRQVLNRAVAWELIDFNPAKRGVENPSPRSQEKRPFDSWAEIDALAGQLVAEYGPMVVFAAATGLRSRSCSRSSNRTSTVSTRLEGMLTDPVYEGKSMAALSDLVRDGRIEPGANVLYATSAASPR